MNQDSNMYTLQMKPNERHLWDDLETRKQVIQGGVLQANDKGLRILRVIDDKWNLLHLSAW